MGCVDETTRQCEQVKSRVKSVGEFPFIVSVLPQSLLAAWSLLLSESATPENRVEKLVIRRLPTPLHDKVVIPLKILEGDVTPVLNEACTVISSLSSAVL